MNLTFAKAQRIRSAHAHVKGDSKYFGIRLSYRGFLSGKAWTPPLLALPSASLSSSNQKKLFLLNI